MNVVEDAERLAVGKRVFAEVPVLKLVPLPHSDTGADSVEVTVSILSVVRVDVMLEVWDGVLEKTS